MILSPIILQNGGNMSINARRKKGMREQEKNSKRAEEF